MVRGLVSIFTILFPLWQGKSEWSRRSGQCRARGGRYRKVVLGELCQPRGASCLGRAVPGRDLRATDGLEEERDSRGGRRMVLGK